MGNVFEDIRVRSKAEGIVEGKVEGEHISRVDVAEKLIKRVRETYQEIADLTGLPIEEVNGLARKETA